jgi:7-carboxy-7-deazaguanine synthase
MKTYTVNEIFYSPQGEGVRAGTMNVFIRFSGCNLQCRMEEGPLSPGGFNCDTEFVSGRRMSAADIILEARALAPKCKNVILTGGEPLLQVDQDLIDLLAIESYYIAVETNGTRDIPLHSFSQMTVDWITCSPKVAEHAIKLKECSEVKYVRGYGQGIPRPVIKAEHKLLSPAFDAHQLDPRAMAWVLQLLKENPDWRLSVQLHNVWNVR